MRGVKFLLKIPEGTLLCAQRKVPMAPFFGHLSWVSKKGERKTKKGLRSMFLHAGNNKNLRLKNIIGIFDMDTATVSQDTKKFLKGREKNGMTEALFEEVPKSFILTNDGKVYFSQISTHALISRVE